MSAESRPEDRPGSRSDNRATTRERIITATAELLAAQGREAVSTRAVSQAAGVQPPTIYRIFGDMAGLLDAVTAHAFDAYLKIKATHPPGPDPVADLRAGWDTHVEFGLANPELYKLMYGAPAPGHEPQAAREAASLLRGLIRRIAEQGRLAVDPELAAQMGQAANSGVVLTLIGTPEGERDPELSPRTREAVLAAITTGAEDTGSGWTAPAGGAAAGGTAAQAIALQTGIEAMTDRFSPAELSLLTEWLGRIARPWGHPCAEASPEPGGGQNQPGRAGG